MPKIFIVNGKGGSGKTSFEQMVAEIASAHGQEIKILSTIDYVKDIAKKIGWDGTKTLENRRMLSDLKDLLTRWNDSPHQDVVNKINNLDNNVAAVFIDSRESEDIKRFVEEYQALTVLVQRGKEVIIYGNHADDNVDDFNYDICVDNSRGLSELLEESAIFYETFIKNEL
jgi:CO dehydrogenase nickel-insertion accessory protein CooC1